MEITTSLYLRLHTRYKTGTYMKEILVTSDDKWHLQLGNVSGVYFADKKPFLSLTSRLLCHCSSSFSPTKHFSKNRNLENVWRFKLSYLSINQKDRSHQVTVWFWYCRSKKHMLKSNNRSTRKSCNIAQS